jgi:hypothetical protein
MAAPSRKICEASLINAARYRACASRAAQTGVGIDEVFQNAFFRRGSALDHPVRSIKGGFATSSDVASIHLRLRPIGLALRALLCQEGSGAPISFTFYDLQPCFCKNVRGHRPPLQLALKAKRLKEAAIFPEPLEPLVVPSLLVSASILKRVPSAIARFWEMARKDGSFQTPVMV